MMQNGVTKNVETRHALSLQQRPITHHNIIEMKKMKMKNEKKTGITENETSDFQLQQSYPLKKW